MLFSFEGVEGSGKSTQIQLLKEFLLNKGYEVLLTRQPGGSILGKKIRNLILDPEEEDKPTPLTELLLYIADRAHHVESIIEPALARNCIILCDRYTDSTIAYQGYARGISIEKLEYLNSIATKDLKPNMTFVLDLDPTIGLTRVKESRNQLIFDRIEAEKIEFHQKVRYGFLQIAQKEPDRLKIIDATQSVQQVTENIINLVRQLL